MKSKTKQIESLDEYQSVGEKNLDSIEKKRLDLNVLLKRMKIQRSGDFKIKVLVTVGAAVLFLIVLTMLNF